MEGIKGKIVLVTGANKGIGKAIAKEFLENGATVVIAGGRDAAATEKAIAELSPIGPVEAMNVDMTNDAAVEAMIDHVVEKYGRIDVLVNNAGVNIREWATDFDIEKFDFVMNVNLRSYFVASRYAARYMKKQGGGCIVCTSSAMSKEYSSKRCAYHISKTGVNGLVSCLATEWARDNIRVNGIAPGYVMTEMVEKGIADGVIDFEAIMPIIPMKRLLKPEEIARPVVFLASDWASGMTGQILFSDGGWSSCGLPESF